ncbi:MAG: hypothetical protein ACYDCP_00200 [Thermoplasmataceae archaeon]
MNKPQIRKSDVIAGVVAVIIIVVGFSIGTVASDHINYKADTPSLLISNTNGPTFNITNNTTSFYYNFTVQTNQNGFIISLGSIPGVPYTLNVTGSTISVPIFTVNSSTQFNLSAAPFERNIRNQTVSLQFLVNQNAVSILKNDTKLPRTYTVLVYVTPTYNAPLQQEVTFTVNFPT